MKLMIEQSEDCKETEIHIKCSMINDDLQRLIDEIQIMMFSVTGKKDGAIHKLSLEDIFYFESVDEKTFACCKEEVYECSLRLYELEKKLSRFSYVRVSKSVVINISKIKSIRPQLNGRFEALLENGEKVIVSRHYVNDLRDKFMGGDRE